MKKALCSIISIILLLSVFSYACAAELTLPDKMHRQLQVGSGLMGSFVLHGNMDQKKYPLLFALNNTEFEIRGIQMDENLHYYIYQPGAGNAMNALTEFCRINHSGYIRSDLFDGGPYLLPGLDHIINRALKSEGENPSVFPMLMKILVSGDNGGQNANTELLEKNIESWITGFAPETMILSSDTSAPSFSQTYSIPVESMYNTATELVDLIFRSDTAMTYLRSILTEDQIALYFNPDLAYYYLDAMKNLDLRENILFTRNVSTMGEPLFSSLKLPLDAGKTGYSSVTFQNDEIRKSILLTGPNGFFWFEMPLHFDHTENEYSHEFRLVRIDQVNPENKSVALRIRVDKKHDAYDDPTESKTHETDHYTVHIVRDTTDLPEQIPVEQIPEMEPADAEIELHYSSELISYRPTTLQFSFSVIQGEHSLDLSGKLETSPRWEFSPFDVSEAVDTHDFTKDDFSELVNIWIANSADRLVHTPDNIELTQASDGE